MIGITPAWLTFNGRYVLPPEVIFRPDHPLRVLDGDTPLSLIDVDHRHDDAEADQHDRDELAGASLPQDRVALGRAASRSRS